MARETREVWVKRVERLADSGLTAKEFATEIGVNANTLAGWRWRLSSKGQTQRGPTAAEAATAQEAACEDATTVPERRPRRTSPVPLGEAVAPMKFVELTTEVPVAPAPSASFEILLRSGVTVRVPGGFDAGELARLVDALAGVRA